MTSISTVFEVSRLGSGAYAVHVERTKTTFYAATIKDLISILLRISEAI